MRRVMITLTVLALLLTGCTAGSSGSDAGAEAGPALTEGSAEGSADVGADQAGDDAATGGSTGGSDDGAPEGVGVADLDTDRAVVTEGSVTLTVEQPRVAARDAAALVEQAGGHVQERVEQAGDVTAEDTAWLVVRIPSDGLTRVLQELERLGRVDSVELTSSDVTAQAQDLDARIRALQISVARLEDLLSRAQTSADVVAAEASLTERQSELESMVSQRDRLADRVAMSTVRLRFQSEEGAPAPVRAGFLGGLEAGWKSLGTALSAGLLVLGVLLPWLVVVGGVVGAVVAVRRYVRRRHPAGEPSVPASVTAGS